MGSWATSREVGGDELAEDAVGCGVDGEGCGEEVVVGCNAGEGAGLVAEVVEGGLGEFVAAFFTLGPLLHVEEGGGMADGWGPQDKAVDDGEDGDVGGHAETDG